MPGFCGFTQTSPEEFLKKVPSLSKDTCNVSRITVEEFRNTVIALNNLIAEEISVRKDKLDASAEETEAAMKEGAMKQMAQQYGLSEEELAKVKNGKDLSQAEKRIPVSRQK